MTTMPTLVGARLVLRALTAADTGVIERLAGNARVAVTTLNVPHPYPVGAAEVWIASHAPAFARGSALTLGVTLADSGEVVGAVALGAISRANEHAELSYWIGVPYWGRGLATEASRMILAHAFGLLGLARVHGAFFRGNDASRRVLEKVGMTYEGTLREHIRKSGVAYDLVKYAVLKRDFQGSHQ